MSRGIARVGAQPITERESRVRGANDSDGEKRKEKDARRLVMGLRGAEVGFVTGQ